MKGRHNTAVVGFSDDQATVRSDGELKKENIDVLLSRGRDLTQFTRCLMEEADRSFLFLSPTHTYY